MFKALSKKIILSNMLLTFVVLLGAFFIAFTSANMNIKHENRETLFALPGLYRSGSVIKISVQGSLNHYQAGSDAGNRMFFVIAVDEQGVARRSGTTSDGGILEESYQAIAQAALTNKNMDSVIAFGSSKLQAHITEPAENSNERELYFLDVTSQYNSLSGLIISFLWIAPLTLIPIFFISLYMAGRATKPVREAWEQQRRFVADASHELKTPLAILSANTDAILVSNGDGNSNSNSNREWLGYIKDEIDRMTKLVNSLLALAKADDSADRVTAGARFDVSLCLDETITLYEAAAFEKGINWRHNIESNVFLNSDENSVRRIVSALSFV